jgi:hypothetical protein
LKNVIKSIGWIGLARSREFSELRSRFPQKSFFPVDFDQESANTSLLGFHQILPVPVTTPQ